MTEYPQFPPGFLFGTATAAYQIEGGWHEDGKGLSIWDVFSHTPGKIKTGETGDEACDTYHDFQTDIDIMRELGLNAYRFSISWPRALPLGMGRVNPKGLDYYNRLVDALLEAGVTPFVTLFHWDMPQALMEAYGGFAGRETALYFADYAEAMARSLGDRVKHWITLNEPWEHAWLGYFTGEHAPGRRRPWQFFQVAHHELLAHGLAVERIRAISPDAQAGVTLSLHTIQPSTPSAKDREAARLADQLANTLFLDAIYRGRYPAELMRRIRFLRPDIQPDDMAVIAQPIDFLGVNYYSRGFVRHRWYIPIFRAWIDETPRPPQPGQPPPQFTAMGWEIYPQGLYDWLMRLTQDYGRPVLYVTENGAAFDDRVTEDGRVHDPDRVAFLRAYMSEAARAIQDGADLRGYFIWTLIDNFEWAEGYSKRFGIVYVDHRTQRRIIKDSGYWVRELIRHQPA